jgi:hypothetical protein
MLDRNWTDVERPLDESAPQWRPTLLSNDGAQHNNLQHYSTVLALDATSCSDPLQRWCMMLQQWRATL